MSKNKSFTPEYKREIVRLVTEQGKKVNELAAEIGVNQTSIYRWEKQYSEHGEHAFPGKGNLRSEDKKNKGIGEGISWLKGREWDTKQAVAIFTNPAK